LIGREGFDSPVAIEPANPRVLLATEWTRRQIDHRLVIHVRHINLHPLSKARATSEIASKDRARQAVLRFRWPAGAPRPRHARE
jgi:hypothetical protein